MAQQSRRRYDDEKCDLCHRNRVAVIGGRKKSKLFNSLDMSHAPCICSDTQPCRDELCAFYRKPPPGYMKHRKKVFEEV